MRFEYHHLKELSLYPFVLVLWSLIGLVMKNITKATLVYVDMID